ncbi:MAG: DNA primase [Burkholderiaceae bacterium]|jgi:DNA primase
MIPNSFIQDLLYRTDVVEIVGRYVQLKKAGANFSGLCPFHKEKTPSFSVSPAKQFYHCFGCGVSGSAINFLMEYMGLPFPEAVEHLATQHGLQVPQEQASPEQQSARSRNGLLLDALQQAQQFYKNALKQAPAAIAYLKRRGLTGRIAARFGMGYAPAGWQNLAEVFKDYEQSPDLREAGLVINAESSDRRYDRFRDRVMFPIRNGRGDVIGFGGRVLDGGEPKYLNSPETPLFSKGQELYGLFEARPAIREQGFVLVVEGYMDVVALAQWSFANTVATLGTAVTAAHLQQLVRYTDRIVFCFDGDTAGRKAAWRALEASLAYCSEERRLEFIFLSEGHDPDSFIREQGVEAFDGLVRQAQPLSQFLLRELEARFPLGDVEGRAAATGMLRKVAVQIPPSAYRVALIRALAEALKTPPAELEQQLGLKRKNGGDVHYAPRPARPRVRAGAAPPERRLAALLLAAPALVERCAEYRSTVSNQGEATDAQLALSLVIAALQSQDSPTVASILELFRDTCHSIEVGYAAQESLKFDAQLDLDTELDAALQQCWDAWIGQELARLAQSGLGSETAQERYRYWTQKRITLKQQRVNLL